MARAGHDYEFFSSFAKDPCVDVEMSHGAAVLVLWLLVTPKAAYGRAQRKEPCPFS